MKSFWEMEPEDWVNEQGWKKFYESVYNNPKSKEFKKLHEIIDNDPVRKTKWDWAYNYYPNYMNSIGPMKKISPENFKNSTDFSIFSNEMENHPKYWDWYDNLPKDEQQKWDVAIGDGWDKYMEIYNQPNPYSGLQSAEVLPPLIPDEPVDVQPDDVQPLPTYHFTTNPYTYEPFKLKPDPFYVPDNKPKQEPYLIYEWKHPLLDIEENFDPEEVSKAMQEMDLRMEELAVKPPQLEEIPEYKGEVEKPDNLIVSILKKVFSW
jgi:hypothetical protein